MEQWKSAGLSTEGEFLCLHGSSLYRSVITMQGNDLLYIIEFDVGILKNKDIETPVVCNIFDVNGEVAAGVASVEALVS